MKLSNPYKIIAQYNKEEVKPITQKSFDQYWDMKTELFVKVREATEDYKDVVSYTIAKFKEMKQPDDEIHTLETLSMDLNNYLKFTSGYCDFISWSKTSIDNPELKDQSWVPGISS